MCVSLLRRQLSETLRSWRFPAIAGVGIVLIVLNYWTVFHSTFVLPKSKPTFFRYMMLFSDMGAGGAMYCMLLPCIAALAGGGLYSDEKNSRRLRMVLLVPDGVMCCARHFVPDSCWEVWAVFFHCCSIW